MTPEERVAVILDPYLDDEDFADVVDAVVEDAVVEAVVEGLHDEVSA